MQRTIRVKLTPSTAQADLLAETSRLFTAAFNAVCRVGWEQIVKSAYSGATIVLENLTDIRKRSKIRKKTKTSRRVHSWSFAQIKVFVAYKAEGRGCTVAGVDPRHTSQACSCCGHVARNNRRSRGRFVCRVCGFELHADLNAARNIAAKYHASGGISPAGELPVNQPIVSDQSPRRSD